METKKVIGKRRFSLTVTTLTFVFLYLPIVALVVLSFNSARQGVAWTGFTLKWYSELFRQADIWKAFLNTVIIALTSSLAATVIGTFTAVALYWYKSRLKGYLGVLVYTPLIIPDILMGVSMLIFFVAIGIPLGLITIFIAHVTFCISYVTVTVMTRLEDFDYSMVEAARDLGAKSHQVFRKVIVPMIMPGMMAGFLLSLTLSIDDFVITFFVAGPGSTTLPLKIYSMIKFGVSPVINSLSTLLLVGTLFISFFGSKFRKLIF
ncbi:MULTISPECIES: ABC transporter permease [unclassified Mesotoga]|uniref:ABC transporter permease n=1 Tax=unclassified Mesotoga TaxID=1184398 RepID=UPI000DA6AE5B|nr:MULTISPECIES: ABC transporter permease subunit [unclassified Mesotoga]PZC51601.1 spermidine/putrescine ABC transporter permease [Mesotoga sp. TolDC]PZC51646.1 spermidine/putrescine ABC transporter permease [Mesotoga sp. TolDC]